MTALQAVSRFDWERIVRRAQIPGATKLVAYTMAQFGDVRGESIRPGVARMAAVCGMGESTVRRHVDALQRLGLLERLANGGGPTKRAARYRLTVPEDLLERVSMLGPDEISLLTQVSGVGLSTGGVSPLTQVSGDVPVDNPELRSPGEVTPLISGSNSAHPGERPSRDHPNQHQGQAGLVVTSPAAWDEYAEASKVLSRQPDFGASLIELAPDEIRGWRERVIWAAAQLGAATA